MIFLFMKGDASKGTNFEEKLFSFLAKLTMYLYSFAFNAGFEKTPPCRVQPFLKFITLLVYVVYLVYFLLRVLHL